MENIENDKKTHWEETEARVAVLHHAAVGMIGWVCQKQGWGRFYGVGVVIGLVRHWVGSERRIPTSRWVWKSKVSMLYEGKGFSNGVDNQWNGKRFKGFCK